MDTTRDEKGNLRTLESFEFYAVPNIFFFYLCDMGMYARAASTYFKVPGRAPRMSHDVLFPTGAPRDSLFRTYFVQHRAKPAPSPAHSPALQPQNPLSAA